MSQPGSERRQWPRVPASSLSHITASVVAGPPVQLVNLSRGGALMEVASRFPMRSRVRLKLTLATGEVTVAEGLVAWARVAAIVNKQVNYLVAIIFDTPIPDLGGLDPAPIQESAPPVEVIEAPPAIGVAVPRGNLSQFPAPAARVAEPVRAVDVWSEATADIVSLDSALDATNDAKPEPPPLSQATPVNDALLAQLAAAEAARNALRDDLEAERRTREDERRTSEAQRRTREEEREKLVHVIAAAAANVETLQASLAAREQDHARAVAELNEQQGWVETLQSALAAREDEHARAVAELAMQQERYEELQSSLAAREQEHVRAVAELVALRNQLEALQTSISIRDDEHAVALAEQKTSYDALAAELLQASLDQQAEYQILMNERAAEREADRLRDEATALEFARLEEEATQAREQLELRCFDLQARLEAAESLCAAHEARDRGLRRELEKLATMVTTLAGTSALNQQPEPKQAVA